MGFLFHWLGNGFYQGRDAQRGGRSIEVVVGWALGDVVQKEAPIPTAVILLFDVDDRVFVCKELRLIAVSTSIKWRKLHHFESGFQYAINDHARAISTEGLVAVLNEVATVMENLKDLRSS